MAETGYYDYAEKISKMPLAIIIALGAVVLPKMSEVIASGKIKQGKRLVHTTMWFMEACAFGLAFGIAGVAPTFVPVFFGAGFERCIYLMSLLSAVIPLICATNVIGVQYLLPCHKDVQYTLSVSCGAAVNVVINIFAIPQAGAAGAAWATVAAEAVVLAYQAHTVKGELDLKGSLKGALPFALIGLGMFLVLRLLCKVLPMKVLLLIAEVLIGMLLYVVASLIWCYVTKSQELKELLPKVAGRLYALKDRAI
jgi:O-antigen/teichoic acid export membrane protein